MVFDRINEKAVIWTETGEAYNRGFFIIKAVVMTYEQKENKLPVLAFGTEQVCL